MWANVQKIIRHITVFFGEWKISTQKMRIKEREKGCFSDYLSHTEVSFSKSAGTCLEQVKWAKKLLCDGKIKKALKCEANKNRAYDEFDEIKSALFEVRFAYALQTHSLSAEYEFPCGLGKTTVDFKILGSPEWFIELTSLRETNHIKEKSFQESNFFGAMLDSDDESKEIIKIQNAILNKVTNSKGDPIKFLESSSNQYNMIIIDIRSSLLNSLDEKDCWLSCYGSFSLSNIEHGHFCRYWTEDGKKNI